MSCTYPEKCTRDYVAALFVPTSVVIVTLPFRKTRSSRSIQESPQDPPVPDFTQLLFREVAAADRRRSVHTRRELATTMNRRAKPFRQSFNGSYDSKKKSELITHEKAKPDSNNRLA